MSPCDRGRYGPTSWSDGEDPGSKARPLVLLCPIRWTSAAPSAARGARLGLRRASRLPHRDGRATHLYRIRGPTGRGTSFLPRPDRLGHPRRCAPGLAKAIPSNFGALASAVRSSQPSGQFFPSPFAGICFRTNDRFSFCAPIISSGFPRLVPYPSRLFPTLDASMRAR